MKAKEFITELFNKTLPYKWTNPTLAEFAIGEHPFIVKFLKCGKNEYSFEFWTEDENDESRSDITNVFKNTGEVFSVFSTVGQILREFVQKNNPSLFGFSADATEESRIKLYNSLAKVIIKAAPEYRLETKYNKEYNTHYYLFHKQS